MEEHQNKHKQNTKHHVSLPQWSSRFLPGCTLVGKMLARVYSITQKKYILDGRTQGPNCTNGVQPINWLIQLILHCGVGDFWKFPCDDINYFENSPDVGFSCKTSLRLRVSLGPPREHPGATCCTLVHPSWGSLTGFYKWICIAKNKPFLKGKMNKGFNVTPLWD